MPQNEVKAKVDELAKTVEEKLGVPAEEVYEQWTKELALIAELRGDLSKEDQAKRAFVRLRGAWKRELRSPAIFYEGVIVRVAPPFDVLRSAHAAAKTMFEADPQKAVREGVTDEQGNALDTRKTFSTGRANPDYGKPLADQRFIQNITGVAKAADMKTPKVFSMILSERLAGKIDVPVLQWVKFRANPARKQPTDGTMALNEYSGLQFRPAEGEFPGPEAIIDEYFADACVAVEDLAEWHKQNANDPRRMAILNDFVDYVDTTPNPATGNQRIVMIDDSGDKEITVWIPPHLQKLVDFGPSSRVIAIGRTAQNTFNNELRTMLNCEGLYAPPEDKVPAEETPESVVSNAEDVN